MEGLKNEKAVITCYPSGYNLDDSFEIQQQVDQTQLKMEFTHFSKDGLIRYKSTKTLPFSEPIPTLYWAAGFSFSHGTLLKDCVYDSEVSEVFFGEEQLQMYRMWKQNFLLFVPSTNVCSHLWSR